MDRPLYMNNERTLGNAGKPPYASVPVSIAPVAIATGTLLLLATLLLACGSSQILSKRYPPGQLPPPEADVGENYIPARTEGGGHARFGIPSGRVVMEYTGNRRGERLLRFDNYGLRIRMDEWTTPYPPGTPGPVDSTISIQTMVHTVKVDEIAGKGWRLANEPEPFRRFEQFDPDAKISMGEHIMNNLPMERLPDTVIYGYKCRTYKRQGSGYESTQWLWRGILIREHFVAVYDNVEFTSEPVEITIGGKYPDDVFEAPEGYYIQEVTKAPDTF